MGLYQRIRSLRGKDDGKVSTSSAVNLVARLLSAGGISFTLDHYTEGVDGEQKLMALYAPKDFGHYIIVDMEFPMEFSTEEEFIQKLIEVQKKVSLIKAKIHGED